LPTAPILTIYPVFGFWTSGYFLGFFTKGFQHPQLPCIRKYIPVKNCRGFRFFTRVFPAGKDRMPKIFLFTKIRGGQAFFF